MGFLLNNFDLILHMLSKKYWRSHNYHGIPMATSGFSSPKPSFSHRCSMCFPYISIGFPHVTPQSGIIIWETCGFQFSYVSHM